MRIRQVLSRILFRDWSISRNFVLNIELISCNMLRFTAKWGLVFSPCKYWCLGKMLSHFCRCFSSLLLFGSKYQNVSRNSVSNFTSKFISCNRTSFKERGRLAYLDINIRALRKCFLEEMCCHANILIKSYTSEIRLFPGNLFPENISNKKLRYSGRRS